jgi:hypothetical protein
MHLKVKIRSDAPSKLMKPRSRANPLLAAIFRTEINGHFSRATYRLLREWG